MRKFILILIATVFLMNGNTMAQKKAELKKEHQPYKPIKINVYAKEMKYPNL